MSTQRRSERGRSEPGRSEQGVVAVVVAICATVVFGVGALVLDVGAARQERRELQNGADAAALALAQFCARGDCNSLNSRAETYADYNATDGQSRATASLLSGNRVRVVTRTDDAGPNSDGNSTTVDFALAPVFGGPRGAEITASATATWGLFSAGATLPLTFSICEWNSLTGGGSFPTASKVIFFHVPSSNGATECAAQAGQDTDGDSKVNGGFGWLDTNLCALNVNSASWVAANPGNDSPNSCSPPALNSILYLPIFDDVIDNNEPGWANQCSKNKCYHIWGTVAFKITGYQLGGNGNQWTQNPPAGCSSSKRCIEGSFQEVFVGWTGGPIGGGQNTHTYSMFLSE